MRKILSIFTVLFTILTFGQNIDPYLQPNSSPTSGQWNKGTLQVDGDFVLPTTLNSFTNPDLRDYGKLRYDTISKTPKFYNGEKWQALATNESIDFIFNNIHYDYDSEPEISPNPADDALIRELGNVVFDENTNQWIMLYSASPDPYDGNNAKIYYATSPSGERNTWVKQGEITTDGNEDPYLLIVGDTYRVTTERKVAGENVGIALFTGTDLESLSDQGLILEAGGDTWYAQDVSSSIERYVDGVYYLFFEGRNQSPFIFDGNNIVRNDGAIGYATSSTGLAGSYTIQNDGNPIIYGYQMGNKTWFTHCISDDIIFLNGKWYITFSAHNRSGVVTGVFESKSLNSDNWTDTLNTWLTIDRSNDDFTEHGIHLFANNGEINATFYSEEYGGIYQGTLNIRSTDKWYYSSNPFLTNSTTYNHIVGKSRNQIIDAPLSTDRTFVFVSDESTGAGVTIILNNTSVYTLTVQPIEGVTFNGSTSDIIIPANSSGKFVTTDVDTWTYEAITRISATDISNWNTAYGWGNFRTFGLGSTAILTNNFNTITQTGFYYSAASTTGAPTTNSGISLLHIEQGTNATQFALRGGADEYWLRRRVSTTWQAWVRIATTDSPAFTGNPTTTTPTTGDNDTSIASTAYVQGEFAAKILSGSTTLDFPDTSAGASSELTITVTGATDGDTVSIGVPNVSSDANSCFTARVSATNTVTVKFNNYSTGSINPASGTFKVKVIK